ncbi:MAG: MFS transporter [Pseudomonadota bacterium]
MTSDPTLTRTERKAQSAAAPPIDAAVPKPGLPTKIAYGIGSVAFGIKDNGFGFFLLLFYSQVLGVPAPLVGLAIMTALTADAFSDPIVGYWSDNARTRWGRRHPFLYGAAIPVGIIYYFIWNPPSGLSDMEMFAYLVVVAVAMRTLLTAVEVPGAALAAELTQDYDERTSFVSFRSFFGWTGGIIMAFVALSVFLVPTETIENGYFNVDGYGLYGLFSAIAITVATLVCAAGTHHRIPYLQEPPEARRVTLGLIFKEIRETLANSSFAALFAAAFFGFLAGAVGASLNHYINGFFWEFTTEQVALITLSILLSALLALIIAPIVSKAIGKKRGAIIVGILAFGLAPIMIILRLLGLLPENGDPLLFRLILVHAVIDTGLIIANQIMIVSMIADIVEQSEVKTGRRSEGIFFAAISFLRKIVSGVGILGASLVVAIAQIPEGATPDQVPAETIRNLGLFYAPAIFVLYTLMLICLSYYKIDRAAHEANLRTLAERRAAKAAASGGSEV